jgi:hypothetical protein
MRTPSQSLPSDFPYSSAVTIIGLRILLTILTLIDNLIMGPLLAGELLILDLFLIFVIMTNNLGPQVAGMFTGQSSCSAPVVCPVLLLLFLAMDLHKALKFLVDELLLEG